MHFERAALSREAKAVHEWNSVTLKARHEFSEFVKEYPDLQRAFDTLCLAAGVTGASELVARHRERLMSVDIEREQRAILAKRYSQLTAQATEMLENARGDLARARKALDGVNFSSLDLKAFTASLTEKFKYGVADCEMKGSDAGKLLNVLEKVTSGFASGPAALLDTGDAAIKELIELRQSKDRGARDNIPYWKIINLIAVFAVFLLGTVIAMLARGQTQAVIVIVTQILVVVGFAMAMIFC